MANLKLVFYVENSETKEIVFEKSQILFSVEKKLLTEKQEHFAAQDETGATRKNLIKGQYIEQFQAIGTVMYQGLLEKFLPNL